MKYIDYNQADLCKALKNWRKSRGISIEDVSIHTGYTRANIYNFEKCQNNNMNLLIYYVSRGFDLGAYLLGGGADA